MAEDNATARRGWMAVALAIVLVVVLGGIAGVLFLPTINDARTPSRRTVCANHIRNIGISLVNYVNAHGGKFPAATIKDKNGKPMHNWRALILANLDRPDLERAYKLDEPWDSPTNRKLWGWGNHLAADFHCPSDPAISYEDAYCSYLLVTGPGTLFPGDKEVHVDDVKDGLENTILLVEVVDSKQRWFEPGDLSFDEALRGINSKEGRCISSFHPGGAYVVFADGHLRFVSDKLSTETLKALLTIDGGETINEDDFPQP